MRISKKKRESGLGRRTSTVPSIVTDMFGYRTTEWYGFTKAGQSWLKEKGCEWVKVEAEPGDLLLCKTQLSKLLENRS